MDACQHCGTVLPTGEVGGRYCPNCGTLTGAPAAVPVGVGGAFADPGASQTHLTAPGQEYEQYFRPAPGERSPHTMTQVIPTVPAQGQPPGAGPGYPPQPYQNPSFGPAPDYSQAQQQGYAPPPQPAYDQPIDYQAATDRPYSEPYEGPYADDYSGAPPEPRSSRAAMIGIGVAAGAILVIIISLITIGGGKPTPTPQAANGPTDVITPTQPHQSASAPSSAPNTTVPNTPTIHVPGQLQLGDTGAEVKWLQNRLKQLNYYNGDATGTFDQATAAAVVAFQGHTHPSDPSGVVGRSTKTALIAAGSRPRLSLFNAGDAGGKKHGDANPDDVKRLQRALSVALKQDVKASGNFDAATVGAVMQYQAAVGLGPDGMVGDKVWAALQQGKITG